MKIEKQNKSDERQHNKSGVAGWRWSIKINPNSSLKHWQQVKEAQTLAGVTLLDMEELLKAKSILLSSQALLMQLELPQPFVLLVARRASVLHQVEAGLGGVVAQRAVVDARLRAVGAVLLLQVLWITERRGGMSGGVQHTRYDICL